MYKVLFIYWTWVMLLFQWITESLIIHLRMEKIFRKK